MGNATAPWADGDWLWISDEFAGPTIRRPIRWGVYGWQLAGAGLCAATIGLLLLRPGRPMPEAAQSP